ncbi:MAG: efflux RND transporter periplasmic adaptor subunit [Candidatus Obscuribacterales bacterium]|nr:efflux RND transporter periplasmic adaptor subunit [Candidatus Obscuribacterales bacterium]
MTFRFSTILLLLLQCLSIQLLSACHRNSDEPVAAPAKSTHTQQVTDTVSLGPEAARAAKIQTFTVEGRSDATQIKTTGEIKSDENRVFHINSIVSGRVVKDNVSLGSMISEGQILAIVQNLEVSKVYGDYIHQSHQNEISVKEAREKLDLYQKTLDRNKKLFDEGIAPQKDVLQAQNQVNLTEIELRGYEEHAVHIRSEAEAMLSAYGVKLGEVKTHVIETGSPLRSPRSGVVVLKNITLGDVVTADQPLYVVADLSQVWLDIAVYDRDLDSIGLGQKVFFRSDSLGKRVIEGAISYIPPGANNTRTFTARAVLQNPGLLLKPGMFGQVEIDAADSSKKPYLPDSAIQKFGNETFAFVALGDQRYQKRLLELANRLGDGYIVKSGIKIGEKVAGEGSFNLKSELLKSQSGQEE